MNLPDGRPLILGSGILVEPTSAEDRIILWLPGATEKGYRHWERVGSVPHAGFTTEQGIRSTAATTVPARQWVGSSFQNLLRRRGGSTKERVWTLPDGGLAEQTDVRRTDLVLAWSEVESEPFDRDRIRARWPASGVIREIGANVFLVSGVEAIRPPANVKSDPEVGEATPYQPRRHAETVLAEARAIGDSRRVMLALADLGLALIQDRETQRGAELLEESLAEARRLGDRDQETNVMIDLGLASLSSAQTGRAKEFLVPALAQARSAGRRFAEKSALDRLGQAHMMLRDYAGALEHFERSLAIAADLGDGPHQADLLWRISLQHAELGRRDRALVMAQAAVDRMRRLGKPQAAWYAHHLKLYRDGASEPLPSLFSGVVDTSSLPAVPAGEARGPGALRMALTAIGSMAKFLGSGFKTASAEQVHARLASCHSCEHHTGMRCRLCGCFTATKSRLLHERCPIGRWEA